jgi:cytoskeletal protein RodZ
MTPPATETETLGLGELLRTTRLQRGLHLDDVAETTKISPKNLKAMEESDFAALPAEVFTRGFYSLYARCLGLDPDEVLASYHRERRHAPADNHLKTPPPCRLAENMKTLAEPPSSLPFAYFGFALLLLLVVGAFLCWYFSFNPASYLSYKLRSLDGQTQVEETALPPSAATSGKDSALVAPRLLELPSLTTATAALIEPRQSVEPRQSDSTGPAPAATRYHLNMAFSRDATVSLTIDDQPTRTLNFREGEQASWRAVEKLVVSLPADSRTRVVLNGISIELPPPEDDLITLAIPESLLR